jgi:low affinity Fe/Cu permease
MNRLKKRMFRFSNLTDFSHWAMDWIGSISALVVHTIFFAVSFLLIIFGVGFDKILLVVTTLVSLEAIYLAIFIQMGVNQNIKCLVQVEENIDEIQEDVDEIQKDVDEIQEDVDEIQKDVDEIEKEDDNDEHRDLQAKQALDNIEMKLQSLIQDIEKIKIAQGLK